MNKYLLFFVAAILIAACNNSSKSQEITVQQGDSTTIQFTNSTFDFGTIVQGETVSHTFNFTNVGEKPYIINEVHSSCGCTVADYSREPLGIGEEGFIKVTFNSAGKHGTQYKVVTISGNSNPDKYEVVIKGEVTIPNE